MANLNLYKRSSTIYKLKNSIDIEWRGPWARMINYSASMERTAFNVASFIQPAFVYEMLNGMPDADGLNDRQLFDFPPEREEEEVFLIEYTLEGLAYRAYQETHDKFVTQKLRANEDNAQGILSKARGHCARVHH